MEQDEGYSLFALCGLVRRFRLAAVRQLRSPSLSSMSRLIKPQAFKRQTASAAASTTKFALIWLSLLHTHTRTLSFYRLCTCMQRARGALLLRCVPSRQRQSNFVLIMCLTKHLAAHRVMGQRVEKKKRLLALTAVQIVNCQLGHVVWLGICDDEHEKWEKSAENESREQWKRHNAHTQKDTHKYTSNLHSLLAMRVRASTLDSAGHDNNSLVSTFCWSNKGQGGVGADDGCRKSFCGLCSYGRHMSRVSCCRTQTQMYVHMYMCVCFVFAYWHAVIIMYVTICLFHHILATRSGNAALMQSTKLTPLVVAFVCHFATAIRPFMKEKKPSEEQKKSIKIVKH